MGQSCSKNQSVAACENKYSLVGRASYLLAAHSRSQQRSTPASSAVETFSIVPLPDPGKKEKRVSPAPESSSASGSKGFDAVISASKSEKNGFSSDEESDVECACPVLKTRRTDSPEKKIPSLPAETLLSDFFKDPGRQEISVDGMVGLGVVASFGSSL